MKKIDSKTLKIMLISGANNLYNHHFEVDNLNVFPVPDGDTGSNMNLTMMNAVKELNGKEYDNFSLLVTTFSEALLMGACGNSGVILSQIFRGFFQVLKTKEQKNDVMTNEELLKAWKSAQEYAYRAVVKPVEGTILTVVKDGADFINSLSVKDKDALFIFEKLLLEMKASLKRTPDLLPVLKSDNGDSKVDSGGAGLVYIVEGMVYALKHNKAVAAKKKLTQESAANSNLPRVLNEHEDFGFCTELIIRLNNFSKLNFNLEQTRNDLEAMDGQSIVLVDDEELIKVHVHTLKPSQISNYFQEFGQIIKQKIDDMTEQVRAHTPTIKPKRKLVNNFALIAAVNGSGMENFFKDELKVDNVIAYSTRLNPSIGDFLKAIEIVDAKNVFILPNDNNLVLSAEQARKLEKKSKVIVIPTTNIAQGMRAALQFNRELSLKDNHKVMRNEIKNVAFGYITISDRDVEIDNIKIEKKHYFSAITRRKHSKPKIVASNEKFNNTVKSLLKKIIWNDAEIVTIFEGKNCTKDQKNYISKILDEDYTIEYDFIKGDQDVYTFLFVVE